MELEDVGQAVAYVADAAGAYPHYLCHLTPRRTEPERYVRAHCRHPGMTVALVYVVQHLVAPPPAEVEVYIGQVGACAAARPNSSSRGVEEALEKEVFL